LFFKVKVLVENPVAVQVRVPDALLAAEAIVQLLVNVIDHDVFTVLEFQYAQDVPEILFHVVVIEFVNIFILIFHFFFLLLVARIFG
jgi:hypothetical protein